MAACYDLDAVEAASRLVGYLKHLGVDYVFDETFGRDLSLVESGKEFVRRFRQNANLPMLASACPGWICYAEKTHGNFVLPYISKIKSPQQIMGSLVKDWLAKMIDKTPDEIFHVSIMPCFDKKLEASRKDFTNEDLDSRDVDCVLTSLELETMLDAKSLKDFPLMPLDSIMDLDKKQISLLCHSGGGSGGYLEYIFRYAARTLFDVQVNDIEYKTLRNQDMKEVTLCIEGQTKMKFAIAYGFRNIQNLVQKLKRGKGSGLYHFVEVMACPAGCLNGGGQIKDNGANQSRELLNEVTKIYEEVPKRTPDENPDVPEIYKLWLDGFMTDNDDIVKVRQFLHTEYHEVEKNVSSLTIKW
jgi:iron only hydrogenase large subunit-like protein